MPTGRSARPVPSTSTARRRASTTAAPTARPTTTNQAVDATRGIVPKYNGSPITAFFFSTSGGHTENIENVWTGASPVPYLKGVPDPYEVSPYHTWGSPMRRTPSSLASSLGFSKGALRAVYAVKRGTSPRIVKALEIGANGYTAVDGATLRARLGLRDTWAYFISQSISPSAATHKSIDYGSALTLSGTRYPAIASGAKITLHRKPAGGSWSTSSATVTAATESVGGYTVRSTDYAAKVTPLKTTEYYITSVTPMGNTAISAHTTVTVRSHVTVQASSDTVATGDKVTFTGTVAPLALAGSTVWLQTKTASGWKDSVSAKLGGSGTCSIDWAAVAGATTLRLRVPASASLGLAEGHSASVTVTAQ